ncbi:AfsR/SARP family transcriptional regulator [Micromonospora chokoriensis]|uniref:DNA-binding transcriptional activator of the SARP family n=1 Tax=Micromonospora chokoriensis TaxID=356851 RepID=A0A1C4XA54_9ACTN|nr:BTAD domain-containing putative transcriptional regulator [Micromonospora chokoriensis]SCF05328.1 DNA-binding transcriptional activator of the SARP family [Micromonospora chokoriensis]
MPTEFGLLGDLQAQVDGHPLDVGHVRQRCVLAALLVDVNQVVQVGQLINRVWGELAPAGAQATLYSYLSRLRACLTPADDIQIIRQSGGYLLAADAASVDLHRFYQLAGLARATPDASQALRIFEESLNLWRGDPLTPLDTPWANSLRTAWERDRVAVDRDRTDLALRHGQHAALAPYLMARVEDHPLDERLVGQLMLALSRSGLQAEALDQYDRLRRRLADSLGVDPTPELQRLHTDVLKGDTELREPAGAIAAGEATVPRQLPAPPPHFAGRARELAELTRVLSVRDGADQTVAMCAVGGPGGVGKTSLALRWAHDNLTSFPDGQLYVNLRGFDPAGPMAPEVALRGFLDGLRLPAASVPADLDARAALYRSLVAGRKMLILLDNAHDMEQVVPLLPGGLGCVVLITSRVRLGGLIANYGARWVGLDVLDGEEAHELLTRLLSRGRTDAAEDSLREIVRRCGGLPLALSIIAARAVMQPDLPLDAVTRELREEATRLDALNAGDLTADLRAVFAASQHRLAAAPNRLFLLLALAPGPEIGLAAAARLADLSPSRTRLLLQTLQDHHLVQQHRPERYRLHDLVRLYAADRAHRDQPPELLAAALRRLVEHYLETAWRAARVLDPQREPVVADPASTEETAEEFTGQDEALAWFAREHPMLLAAVEHTATQGLDQHTWQLAWTLETFLDYQGHWRDWAQTQRLALDAARRLHDPLRQAHAHRSLGLAGTQLGLLDDAYDNQRRALALFGELGDEGRQADIARGLGWICHQRGHWAEALDFNQQALTLYQHVDHRPGQAMALNNLGWLHVMLGEHRRALAFCTQAVAVHQEIGDTNAEAGAWDSLGFAHHHLGEYAQAVRCYERALELVRGFHEGFNEADILRHLAETRQAAGDPDGARACLEAALSLLEQLDHPAVEQVRADLDRLGGAP